MHTSLLFNEIALEFTAHLRVDDVKKSWLERLPQHVSSNSLLFQGAPDLINKSHKPEGMLKSEGMIFADVQISQHEDSNEDTKEDDSPSSQDSAVSARI